MTSDREPTYFHFNKPIKQGLQKIALHNHTTLSNLLEEGARYIIHKESIKIKEDMNDLSMINQLRMN